MCTTFLLGATSTLSGIGEVKWTKFESFFHHIVNKHKDFPNKIYNKCHHSDIMKPRVWLTKGIITFLLEKPLINGQYKHSHSKMLNKQINLSNSCISIVYNGNCLLFSPKLCITLHTDVSPAISNISNSPFSLFVLHIGYPMALRKLKLKCNAARIVLSKKDITAYINIICSTIFYCFRHLSGFTCKAYQNKRSGSSWVQND
jgi:hypothetical protein